MSPDNLQQLAEAEVDRVLRELPNEVALAMKGCSIRLLSTFHELSPETGPEEDLLGLFEGATWGEAEEPGQHPPCITLFLETIWAEAAGDVEMFRKEVRLTLLHEIGHFLGWDEGEVEARGLG